MFAFALAGVAVVYYINNRKAFLKKSLFALTIAVLLAFGGSILLSQRNNLLSKGGLSLVNGEEQKRNVESASLWSNLINYLAHVLADRVKE